MKTIPIPLFDQLNNLKSTMPNQLTHLKKLLHFSVPFTKVKEDYTQAIEFIGMYGGSYDTFKTYNREVARLLLWTWLVSKKTLASLSRRDVEDYLHFCQNPPSEWIACSIEPRFLLHDGYRVYNKDWRPFVAKKFPHRPSESAIKVLFAITSSFFSYLCAMTYIQANPVLQIRQMSKYIRKHQRKRIIRRLSKIQITYVLDAAKFLASVSPAQHERTLFVMHALILMYLRVSELVASSRWIPQMGHFYKDMDDNWWFKTVGKGNKERSIAVCDAMLDALKHYRASLGLNSLPSPGDKTPLLINFKDKVCVGSSCTIRRMARECFDLAKERLYQDGYISDAEGMDNVTVHWLRHTGISEDVKIRPREHVRDDAGHSSGVTTDHYIDIELRARAESAKNKQIRF